ncbi:MAG: biotin/lipoyl-binding protein [Candidatus Niameybacter stercoravium]|nr:biotin/lipoyl-binding protein [Candidatus Niameybacter stercoravium]
MRKFQVTVNGNTYEVEVEELGAGASVASAPYVAPVQVAQATPKAVAPVTPAPVASTGAHKVAAPMPGKIVDVKVSVGQTIKEGDLVAILEAMKMENEIFASASGTVASVNVSAGNMVEANDVIISIN